MTAKEKAIDLVNKFREFANGNDDESDRFSPAMEKQNGKNCAIIAVDEILLIKKEIWDDFHSEYFKYWQEVKQEIEKL